VVRPGTKANYYKEKENVDNFEYPEFEKWFVGGYTQARMKNSRTLKPCIRPSSCLLVRFLYMYDWDKQVDFLFCIGVAIVSYVYVL